MEGMSVDSGARQMPGRSGGMNRGGRGLGRGGGGEDGA